MTSNEAEAATIATAETETKTKAFMTDSLLKSKRKSLMSLYYPISVTLSSKIQPFSESFFALFYRVSDRIIFLFLLADSG
tara:strand:+ start:843 stop:1082 length:240 start_codon:yes stop_codon:yes gene_type:complete